MARALEFVRQLFGKIGHVMVTHYAISKRETESQDFGL